MAFSQHHPTKEEYRRNEAKLEYSELTCTEPKWDMPDSCYAVLLFVLLKGTALAVPRKLRQTERLQPL